MFFRFKSLENELVCPFLIFKPIFKLVSSLGKAQQGPMTFATTTASAIEVQKAKPLHGRVASRSPVELCWVFHASPLPTRSGSDCFAGFAGANKIHAAVLGKEQPLFPALVMPAKAECLVESPALAGGWNHNWLYGPKFALHLPGCSSFLPGLPKLEKLHSRL